MIAELEQIEEPAVELLVHPEVARAAGLVREPAGGDDGHAQRRRIGANDFTEQDADPVGALGARDRRHRAVHGDGHQAKARVGVQVVRRNRDAVVELHRVAEVRQGEPAPRALVDEEAREARLTRHAILFHPQPLVEPVGGPHMLAADADRVLGHVVHRPVEQVIVAEHHEHVGPRGLEPAPHLRRRAQGELLVFLRGAIEPAGEAGRVRHGHGRDDLGHAQRPSTRCCSAMASAVSRGNARL